MLLFAFLPPLLSEWRGRSKRVQALTLPLLRLPVLLLVIALVIACSIGLARIYVGVHYPGDILGGAIDGLFAASLVTWLRHWLRRPTRAILRFASTLRLA